MQLGDRERSRDRNIMIMPVEHQTLPADRHRSHSVAKPVQEAGLSLNQASRLAQIGGNPMFDPAPVIKHSLIKNGLAFHSTKANALKLNA